MSDLSQQEKERLVREKKTWFNFMVNNSHEFESEVFKSIARQLFRDLDEDKLSRRAEELKTIFYDTLKSFYEITSKGLSWRFSLVKDSETLRKKITELRVKSVKRKRYIPRKNERKIDKLEPLFPVIKSLRERGLSYSEIREYLSKYHKVQVSESLVKKFMKKVMTTCSDMSAHKESEKSLHC